MLQNVDVHDEWNAAATAKALALEFTHIVEETAAASLDGWAAVKINLGHKKDE